MVDCFLTQSSHNRILMVMGLYRSLSRFWPVCWKMYVSATQFNGEISQQSGWHCIGRIDSANQRAAWIHKPLRGVVLAELGEGEPLVAADLDGRQEVAVEANKNGKMTETVGHVLVALVAGDGNGGAPLLLTHVTQRLRQ
jgi:hypothetical protein